MICFWLPARMYFWKFPQNIINIGTVRCTSEKLLMRHQLIMTILASHSIIHTLGIHVVDSQTLTDS